MSAQWVQCENGTLINLNHCAAIWINPVEWPNGETLYEVIAGEGHVLASRLTKERAQEILDYLTYNALHAIIPT